MTLAGHELIPQIHASPLRGVVVVTGGGSLALSELLCVPGASRTVLEAAVPYAAAALVRLLGAPPEQFCSPRTARAMAMAAFDRALVLDRPASAAGNASGESLVGVACTASLASDRPKRGEHRAYIAVQTLFATETTALTLHKDARTRLEEEQLVASVIIERLAVAAGVARAEQLAPLWEPEMGEARATARTEARPEWRRLLLGELNAVCTDGRFVQAGGKASPRAEGPLLFPGAFNPLHDGHRQIALIAAAKAGRTVEFEVAVQNVDKPPLDYVEIQERLGQFGPDQPVWLTRLPTFLAKARAFPGATFVVGADTAARIADPRYYGGDTTACQSALRELSELGSRFLVFGRLSGESFETLSDLQLPQPLRHICTEIPAAEFRADVSSTDLRRGAPES